MLLFFDESMFPGMDLSPLSHDAIALASLRDMNRELLVVSQSNISDEVASLCQEGREKILAAIYKLDPLPDNSKRPLEERPVADYLAAVAASASKFDPIIGPKLQDLDVNDTSRN